MTRTRFEERYEVGDKVCGVIAYFPTYNEAWAFAGLAYAGRHKECGDITIYDRMAHKGKPELWRQDGLCLQIKSNPQAR